MTTCDEKTAQALLAVSASRSERLATNSSRSLTQMFHRPPCSATTTTFSKP